MAQTLETLIVKLEGDITGLRRDLDRATRESTRSADRISGSFRRIQTAATAAFAVGGALFAANGLIRGLGSLASQAQRAENAVLVFNKQLQRSNVDVNAANRTVEALSERFGVLPETIQEASTLILRAGGSLEDVERALTAAGASAAATGFDISRAFENVSTAVATGRSELLETSGIVANLGPVQQQYAASIGKTVEELTDAELVQARVNAIYNESASEIEDVDELLEGLTGNQSRVTTEFAELRRELGKFLLPAVNNVVGGFADLLGSLNGFIDSLSNNTVQDAAQNVYDALASGSTESVVAALDEVIERVGEDGNSGARDALTKLREDLIQTGDVSVEQAERIVAAFADLDLATRGRTIFGVETLGDAESQIRRVGNQTQGDPFFFLDRYETALNNLDFEGALAVVEEVRAAAEASGGRLAEFNRDLVPLLDAFDAFFEMQANLPSGVVRDRTGATGAASTAGDSAGGGGGAAPTGTEQDPVSVRFAGPTSYELGVRGLGRREISAPEVSARVLPQSQARQFTVPTSYEQAGQALARGFIAENTRALTVPGISVGGDARGLVAPNVQQTGTLEPTASIANLRVELREARADFEVAGTDAARQSIAQKIVELEEAIAALERARTPVALGVTPIASGRGPAVALPVPEPTVTGEPVFADTGAEGAAPELADDFTERFNDAGEQFANEALQGGLEFVSQVDAAGQAFIGAIDAFASGNIGGGVSALGQGIGSIVGAVNPLAGAIIGVGSGLLGGLLNLGQGDEGTEANSAQSRRSLSQLELNFTFNQSNSLGLLDDPTTTRKLEENAESAFRRFEDIVKRNINPRLDALEARI